MNLTHADSRSCFANIDAIETLPIVLASLLMTSLAMGASWVLGLRLTKSLVTAVIRATIQLLVVGLALSALLTRDGVFWAWLWVLGMIVMASVVLMRRSPKGFGSGRYIFAVGVGLLGCCTVMTMAVFFGLGAFEYQPITMLVLVGLTIGNAMPGAVLAIKQTHAIALEKQGELEAILAFGSTRRQTISFLAQQPAKLSLIPQIERTKVVGLIALPGAMSGLLLAGTDPIEAVVTQLLVMFMVLGSVALSVLVLTLAMSLLIVTPDLRVASWLSQTRSEQ